jgi:hypothetical protein
VARKGDGDDLYHLGDIDARLLVTPDLNSLLKSAE